MPRDNRGRDASVEIRQDNQDIRDIPDIPDIQDNPDQAPKEQGQPVGNAREDSSPRSETPVRPLQQDPVKTPEIQDVQSAQVTPVVHVDPKPIEKKEESAVTKPKKSRRGFGGLGARIKERRLEAKAAEEALANPPAETASPAVEERPAATMASPAPASPPAPERMVREQRAPSFSRSRADEEVILSGIKGTKYAKALGSVTDEGLDEALTELTDGMLARAGFPCQCETFPGEYRQIKVTTDDASAGMLIGRHGQAIDAVEHLVERMASNAIDARARINLDINNYRMHREESLAERVAEAAAAIKETGRPFHMEPMSARERRLVHMETAELGGLRTFTMDGSGGKHVVIAADEEVQAETQPEVQPEYHDEAPPKRDDATDVATDDAMVDHPVDDAEERNNPDT
jgi:spoIIIJ-associated protein